jgi:hypothetical protein
MTKKKNPGKVQGKKQRVRPGSAYSKMMQGGQGSKRGKLSNLAPIKGNRPYVTHVPLRCEPLGDVSGSVAFVVQKFLAINPGQASTFPWLSGIAGSYEFYEFKKLWFEFKTSSGEVVSGSNPALGRVVMVTNFDSTADAFSDKIAAETYEGMTVGAPYDKVIRHKVNASGRRLGQSLPIRERYVRTGSLPTNRDPEFCDVGNFQFVTSGMPAANIIGELWVHYEVDLIKPLISTATIASGPLADGYYGDPASTAAIFAGSVVTDPSTLTAAGYVTRDDVATITFNVTGTYYLTANFTGTLFTAIPDFVPTGCTVLNAMTEGGAVFGASSIYCIGAVYVLVTAPGQFVNISPNQTSGNITQTNVQLSYNETTDLTHKENTQDDKIKRLEEMVRNLMDRDRDFDDARSYDIKMHQREPSPNPSLRSRLSRK